jgi:hypothetical protein
MYPRGWASFWTILAAIAGVVGAAQPTDKGPNGFASNPPNAAVTVFQSDGAKTRPFSHKRVGRHVAYDAVGTIREEHRLGRRVVERHNAA